MSAGRKKRILAVASAGGHWAQLMRLRPAFDGCDVVYTTTDAGLSTQVLGSRFFVVRDASIWSKALVVLTALQVLLVVLRVRPDVVISTGAAPGFLAVLSGRLLGARTIWIDSIANSEELSLAGQKAGRVVDHWLTQWPELARPGGPDYLGGVL